MAFCRNCGEHIHDDEKFCKNCGHPMKGNAETGQVETNRQPQYQQSFQQGVDRLAKLARNTADETGSIDRADIEKNKTMGGIAYFLFFVPLLACPESKYGRFHANQGLLYLFLCIAGGVANSLLQAIFSSISWRLWWIWSAFSFVIWVPILIIGVVGLINGFSGKAKELPIIGKFRLIKF